MGLGMGVPTPKIQTGEQKEVCQDRAHMGHRVPWMHDGHRCQPEVEKAIYLSPFVGTLRDAE